jgi:formylglycine-generating enzyme required for sulfatase activity
VNRGEVKRGALVALAALILGALVAQIAVAGGAGKTGEPKASASAVSNKKFKKLKQQVAVLQKQVDQLARQPGPQGPPGPAGSAPACQGNGSGDEMVAAGAVCIDKYEVSVWSSPTGGTQYGASTDNYPCDDEGHDCTNIYARSVPGVKPSAFITYFQAQQALANVGKRLPTNAEWQQAVAGTPDPGGDNGTTDCRTTGGSSVNTGSRSACVSRFGAFDMVGNLSEWVGDWVPASTTCPGWGNVGTFSSNDTMCLSGASTTQTGPGALFRGGGILFGTGTFAGPFAVDGVNRPSDSNNGIGFRGAR